MANGKGVVHSRLSRKRQSLLDFPGVPGILDGAGDVIFYDVPGREYRGEGLVLDEVPNPQPSC